MINFFTKEKKSEEAATMLNVLLADEFRLYTKTFRFHWNMNLRDYVKLYTFFENQYDSLAKIIDDLAEYLKKNNFEKEPFGEYLKLTHITDENKKYNRSEFESLLKLAQDHEIILNSVRKNVFPYVNNSHDASLSKLITVIIAHHEKIIKMIKTYLA